MLRRLSIRDIVLVEALDLDFGPGLGVLTGETGAGKSILLDALGLALGARGGGDLVRAGAQSGSVSALFEPPAGHPAHAWLAEQGLEADADDPLILRRTVAAGGRARAFINDQPVSAAALRALGGLLVEIHGQFDDRGLMNPAGHRALLDAHAGLGADVAALRRLHRQLVTASEARKTGEAELEEARRDVDYLRHTLEELEALAPEPGEEDALDTDRRAMQAAERIAGDVVKAAEALGAQGAEGLIADAFRRLDVAAPKAGDRLDAALAAIDRAQQELSEAIAEVDAAMEALSFDPARLETVEERLFALRALARKHQVPVDELPSLRAAMTGRIGFIEAGEERLKALHDAETQTREAYDAAAQALSSARAKGARQLEKAVASELAPLKMERAVFMVRITPAEPGAEGIDRIAFEVSTNPGASPGPIDRVASGGELSRFLLAIKVCLAHRDDDKTLIFDEIDRGVGGATAAAIGQRLRRLGETAQVLVITHAPQVAALGRAHWRISKDTGRTRTRTNVSTLDAEGRIEELARMLAGEHVTDAARAAARSLMGGDDGHE